jgi:hypothetical protein
LRRQAGDVVADLLASDGQVSDRERTFLAELDQTLR